MLKMKEHKSKFVASILTLFVIGLLIIAGPASAFEVSIAEFDNATPTQGETVSTIATIDIASLERANITKITLFSGKEKSKQESICDFDATGKNLSACSGVSIELLSSNASYGYGYNGYAYGYGYSYGYGYGNNLGASKLTYKIIVNTTNFSMGANWFSLSVNDGTPTDDQKIVVRPVQAQSHTRSNVDNVASGLLLAGYTSTMRSNEILSFKLNGEAHTLKLLGIKNNQVNIVVSSTPQYATLSEGQSKEFDLDEDGVKDLLVSVLKIDSSTADIKIQKIEKAVLTASVLQNPNEVKPNNPVNPPVTNTPGRAKGKLAGITGAFIGTLGTGGSIATVVIILLVVIGLIILVRRKKASSQ